jgi:hypothetical protein
MVSCRGMADHRRGAVTNGHAREKRKKGGGWITGLNQKKLHRTEA